MMKRIFAALLLCSSVGYAAFNLDDWDLHEIEFFDVDDEFIESACRVDRGSEPKSEDEMIAALDARQSFTTENECITREIELAVSAFCLSVMQTK